MGYKIRRGGRSGYESYLTTSAFESIDDPDHPDPDKRKWTDDRRNPSDWTDFERAHVFEVEDEAHKWAHQHDGHEGQLSVVTDKGERIEDPRAGGEFNETVNRYVK